MQCGEITANPNTVAKPGQYGPCDGGWRMLTQTQLSINNFSSSSSQKINQIFFAIQYTDTIWYFVLTKLFTVQNGRIVNTSKLTKLNKCQGNPTVNTFLVCCVSMISDPSLWSAGVWTVNSMLPRRGLSTQPIQSEWSCDFITTCMNALGYKKKNINKSSHMNA